MKRFVVSLMALLLLSAMSFTGTPGLTEAAETKAAENFSVQMEKLVIPGLKLQFQKDGPDVIEIDKLEITAPNLAAARDLAQAKAEASTQPLAEAVVMTGIRIKDDDGTLTVDRLEVTKPAAGPLPLKFGEQTEVDEKKIPGFLQSLSSGLVEVQGLAFESKDGEEGRGKVAKFTVSQLQQGKTGLLELNGLNIIDEKGKTIWIESFRLENLDVSKLLAALNQDPPLNPEKQPAQTIRSVAVALLEMKGLEAKDASSDKQVATLKRLTIQGVEGGRIGLFELEGFQTKDKNSALVSFESFRADGMDFNKLLDSVQEGKTPEFDQGSPMTLNSFAVKSVDVTSPKGDHFVVGEISLSEFKQGGMLPESISFKILDLEVEVDKISDKKAKQTLTALGYQNVALSLLLNYSVNAQAQSAELKELSLKAKDMGELRLALQVEGVDMEKLQDKEKAAEVLGTLTLKKAEIQYVDASLAGKLLEFAAKANDQKPEEMRAMIVEMVKMQLEAALKTPVNAQAVENLVKFINDPKELTITSAPAQPVPIMMLAAQAKSSPDDLLRALSLLLNVNDTGQVQVLTAP